MDRLELISKLELLSPALADNDLSESFNRYWFLGEMALAFNGQMAISCPLQLPIDGDKPFEGMVSATLLEFLKASLAKEVTLVSTKTDEVIFKAAKAKFKIQPLPIPENLFAMPDDDKSPIRLGKSFIKALETVMRSVTFDATRIERLGVTFMPEGDNNVSLYSTNGSTISHAITPLKHGMLHDMALIVSGEFAKQLLQIAAKENAWLSFRSDHVLAGDSSGTRLFGYLIDNPKPLDYRGVVASFQPKNFDKTAVAMPAQMLDLIINRALIGSTTGKLAFTNVSIAKGLASFVTRSEIDEISDKLMLDSPHLHPDVSMRFDASLLKSACKDFDKLLFTERCIVMTGKNNLYLVASGGSE